MRIESGIINQHEIPECDLAPREPVLLAHTAPAAHTAAKPPLDTQGSLLAPAQGNRGILGSFFNAIASLFEDAIDTARSAIRSWGDAFTRPVNALFAAAGMVVLAAGKAASVIQTLFQLESPGRRLNEEETRELRQVYGNGVNLNEVRLKEGNAGLFSLPSARRFTLGNAIYTNSALPLDRQTLVHEMMHIWQFQQRGAGYIAQSLITQATLGVAETYDWQASVTAGTPFKYWNPERQAQLIEDAVSQRFFEQSGPEASRTFIVDGKDYASDLRAALSELRGAR